MTLSSWHVNSWQAKKRESQMECKHMANQKSCKLKCTRLVYIYFFFIFGRVFFIEWEWNDVKAGAYD